MTTPQPPLDVERLRRVEAAARAWLEADDMLPLGTAASVLRAALAAQPAPPLDVERLGRAMVHAMETVPSRTEWESLSFHQQAVAIAREYAALRAEAMTPTPDPQEAGWAFAQAKADEAKARAHPVYPEGPPCNPSCPGPWSTYHDGYADGYERAAQPAPPLDVERLAEAIEAAQPLPLGWAVDGPEPRRRAAYVAQARSVAAQYASLSEPQP